MKKIVEMWNRVSLIAKILVGIVIGAVLGLLVPGATGIGLIGTMFVRALKAIAPILVFALVISSIANAGKGNGQQFRMVTIMYMLSTLCAAIVAVSASFIFPVTMTLDLESYQADVVPSGIMEVLQNLLLNITDNPVNAILNANYLCILAWALLFGLAMRRTSKSIKSALVSISDAVSTVVRWIIGCAPFGIMGLVFTTVSESGLSIFKEYGRIAACACGRHAYGCIDRRSAPCDYRLKEKCISTCVEMPQRVRCDGVLHQKFCGKYPSEHVTLQKTWT